MPVSFSEQNLNLILQNITQHSPHPTKVNIVAVTKGFSYEAILSALSHKINCIGENKVQEFLHKKNNLTNYQFESHLIGHLQSNKIKKAIQCFDVIQTIDSIELANKINTQMEKYNAKKKIFIQVNIGNDPKKFGADPKNIFKTAETINKMPHLQIKGIMTILPYLSHIKSSEKLFNQTRKILEKIKNTITPSCSSLSMGMSRDYVYALKQGATHIRIGTLLYGNR